MQEEPEYQLFDYTCEKCGGEFRQASAVRLHPDHQCCPYCNPIGPKVWPTVDIFKVLNLLRQNGVDCFLADGPTTVEMDNAINSMEEIDSAINEATA